MELLFRREQTAGQLGRVHFKLWGKIELDEDEQAIVKRYKFDEAVLLQGFQPLLVRKSALIGGVMFVVVFAILAFNWSTTGGFIMALIAGGGFGYWYFHENRETIFVRDLMHGRNFICPSVIELAREEARLADMVSYLRQVMESAKHWDGTERLAVEALPKDEARQVMIRGF